LEEGPEMEDHTKNRSKGYLSSYRVDPRWWMIAEEVKKATEVKEQEEWLEEVENYEPPSPPLPLSVSAQGATSCTPYNDTHEDPGLALPEQSQELLGETGKLPSPDSLGRSSLDSSRLSNEPGGTSFQRPSSELLLWLVLLWKSRSRRRRS